MSIKQVTESSNRRTATKEKSGAEAFFDKMDKTVKIEPLLCELYIYDRCHPLREGHTTYLPLKRGKPPKSCIFTPNSWLNLLKIHISVK